ncbi:MAG: phosphoribosylaminoimidazolesuccinocarboxamide synthase [Methanosarcinaceae archaeon]
MKDSNLLYAGKTKRIFCTENEDQHIIEFLDTIIEKDTGHEISGNGIGRFHTRLTSYLYDFLSGYHIPTHFIRATSDVEILVKPTTLLPFTIVISNYSNSSLQRRYGVASGRKFSHPVIEYFLRDTEQNEQLINASHVVAFGFLSPDESRLVQRLSSKINAVLKSLLFRRDLKLLEFQLDFGLHKNKLILCNEFTMNSCKIMNLKKKIDLSALFHKNDQAKIHTALAEIEQQIF